MISAMAQARLVSYCFTSYDGSARIHLTSQQLSAYPDCLFSRLVRFDLSSQKTEDGSYVTSLADQKSLDLVKYFFDNGVWKNPYIYGNGQLKVHQRDYTFDQVCEHLGLPCDDEYIEDLEDEDPYEDWTKEDFEEAEQARKQEEREYEEYLREKEMDRRERLADLTAYSYERYDGYDYGYADGNESD